MRSEARRLLAPLNRADCEALCAGDEVLLSGVIYVARDAAHKRMVEALENGEPVPADLWGAVIFYAGPSPARPGLPIGSIGPTTSYRMDPYAPALLEEGVRGMIGKGDRSPEVVSSIVKNGAVYFGAAGGIAALFARSVASSEIIGYEDLGPEAMLMLDVREMPLTVLIDSRGTSLYLSGRERFRRAKKA